jgi:hypothetical protein
MKPTTDSFASFQIYVGDGESPETFAAPCGFTQKSLTLSAANSTAIVPDCDNPEAPSWEEAGVTALSAVVAGQGVMAEESDATWREWFVSGASRNVRIAKRLGWWAGKAILTELGESVQLGSEGNRIQRSVSLRNDGEWTWVPAA